MKQVVQNFKGGRLVVDDVPAPVAAGPQTLLVANQFSLISAGTERATLDLARRSLIGKARARPDLVRKVLDSVRRDGILDTAKTVAQRLDRSAALGYSCAGIVVATGTQTQGFNVGDRIACAGQNHASHAELVVVPQNLCVAVPTGVNLADAAYVALGAIALQSVRQTEPRLGEIVVVIGLGLVGLLTAQLLKANGCRVIGCDPDAARADLARRLGVDRTANPAELANEVLGFTNGYGADAVVIAASTPSSAPVSAAGAICRHKGRVVVVGAVGMDVPREPFYRKELELRLSTSYGPGRYETNYEDKGLDYPYGYVRWTEQRNMAAFLDLVAQHKVDVAAMTSHTFAIGDAEQAFELVASATPHLGILITYPSTGTAAPAPRLKLREAAPPSRIELGLIGAGSHVRDMLLPHLRRRSDVRIRAVCCATGMSAKSTATRTGAEYCTTRAAEVLEDPNINAVLIGARHDLHAELVISALRNLKHVFVEKPLCLTEAELRAIEAAYADASAAHAIVLSVGFNRRHSAHVRHVIESFERRQTPLSMVYRVNAGALPADHWLLDPHIGGGRMLGEACHFIDTLQALTGAPAVRIYGSRTRGPADPDVIATIDFADGSVASLIYTVAGDRALAKERIEVAGDGVSAVIDDFAVTDTYMQGRRRRFKSRGRDKGFGAEIEHFAATILNPALAETEFYNAVASTRATLRLVASLITREPIDLE